MLLLQLTVTLPHCQCTRTIAAYFIVTLRTNLNLRHPRGTVGHIQLCPTCVDRMCVSADRDIQQRALFLISIFSNNL
jgi:hypothetical protein